MDRHLRLLNTEPDYFKIVQALEVLDQGARESGGRTLRVTIEIVRRVNIYLNEERFNQASLDDIEKIREILRLDLKREAELFLRLVGTWPLPVVLANTWVNDCSILIGRIPDFSVSFVHVYSMLE